MVASQPKHWSNNKNVTHVKVKMYIKAMMGRKFTLSHALEKAAAHYRVPMDQLVKVLLIPGNQVPSGVEPPPAPKSIPDMDKVSTFLATGTTTPKSAEGVMRKPSYEQLDKLATAFFDYINNKPSEGGILGDQSPESVEKAARELEREEDIVPKGISRNEE